MTFHWRIQLSIPKDTRYRYDEPMLAGAGVALRFSEYLYSRAMKHRNQLKRIKYDWGEILQRLSQFCAIGTVADLVPLNHISIGQSLRLV